MSAQVDSGADVETGVLKQISHYRNQVSRVQGHRNKTSEPTSLDNWNVLSFSWFQVEFSCSACVVPCLGTCTVSHAWGTGSPRSSWPSTRDTGQSSKDSDPRRIWNLWDTCVLGRDAKQRIISGFTPEGPWTGGPTGTWNAVTVVRKETGCLQRRTYG